VAGTLPHLAKVLGDAKVNVVALLGSTAGTQGSVQVVVDNVNKAKKALGGAGLLYTEGTLEQFELANKPGALAGLAGSCPGRASTSTAPTPPSTKGAKKAIVVLGTLKTGETGSAMPPKSRGGSKPPPWSFAWRSRIR
jgi:hypothetical protein